MTPFSLGVGLTNACDLACAHCYRETERIDQLTLEQVTGVCECLPVRSVNLGTTGSIRATRRSCRRSPEGA